MMSDALIACEERGINPEAPDALEQLWRAMTAAERRETFPHAFDVECAFCADLREAPHEHPDALCWEHNPEVSDQ